LPAAPAATQQNPSALSSLQFRSVPPERADAQTTALQSVRRSFGDRSYSGHSPPLRHFNRLVDHSQAPATTPAAAVVPVLALTSIRPFTSLSGVTHGPVAVCPRLPARHSFRQGDAEHQPDDFGGQNTEAPPLPISSRLFAVRHRLRSDSLARAFAPLMVELFTVGVFVPTPSLVRGPVSLVAKLKAPHASRG